MKRAQDCPDCEAPLDENGICRECKLADEHESEDRADANASWERSVWSGH